MNEAHPGKTPANLRSVAIAIFFTTFSVLIRMDLQVPDAEHLDEQRVVMWNWQLAIGNWPCGTDVPWIFAVVEEAPSSASAALERITLTRLCLWVAPLEGGH